MRALLVALAVSLLLPVSAQAQQLFITEVAWMGSSSSASDEWIELHNPGAAPAELADFEIFHDATSRPLPALSVPAGGFVIVERRDTSTDLAPPDAVQISFGTGLRNDPGHVLRLCPLGQSATLNLCDIANEAAVAWPAGDNTTDATMSRVGELTLGVQGTFIDHPGPLSAVLDSGGLAINGSPGALTPDPGQPVDAGPDPVDDAGPIEPFDYPGLAVTEIYFNPPGTGEAGKEWVEIANLSTASISLDGAVVERVQSGAVARTATVAGTGITLAPGDHAVLAQSTDLGVGVCAGANLVVFPTSELQLANSGTQIIRVTQGGVVNEVQYSGGGAPGVGEANAFALTSTALDNGLNESFGPSPCEYAAGVFGSPGVRNEDCLTLGALPECVPIGNDAGPVDPPVLPPNDPPTISLSAPTAATSDNLVNIAWTTSDPDPGDLVEVALFFDTNEFGNDGVQIARGLGGSGSFDWTTIGVPPGTYSVFGRATDRQGATAFGYAIGLVTVAGGGEIVGFSIVEPDGVNDTGDDGKVLISWSVDIPADAEGTVSLFFDTDQEGFDGEPITGGLPVRNGDGTLAPTEFLWDPTGVPRGSFAVYGVLDWSRGDARDYGEFVTVGDAPGCSQGPAASGALLLLSLLGLLWLRRRH